MYNFMQCLLIMYLLCFFYIIYIITESLYSGTKRMNAKDLQLL